MRTSRAYLDVRVELDVRVADEKSEGALVLRGWVGRPGEKPSSGYRVRLTASQTQQTGETKAIAHRLTRETHDAPAGGNDWQHLEVSVSRDQMSPR